MGMNELQTWVESVHFALLEFASTGKYLFSFHLLYRGRALYFKTCFAQSVHSTTVVMVPTYIPNFFAFCLSY